MPCLLDTFVHARVNAKGRLEEQSIAGRLFARAPQALAHDGDDGLVSAIVIFDSSSA
jgi:hypothetical protein